MGKRYGEPYDPKIRTSEHGSLLYNFWRRVRKHPHCEEWDYYPTFYDWAIHNGYTLGAPLRLIDKSKPYSPKNCVWYADEKDMTIDEARAAEWNAVVNRIRKHYGMPPLEGTNYVDV